MSYFDVQKEKWQGLLGISDKDIPDKLIIEGQINYPILIEKRAKKFTNVKKAWMPNLILGEYGDQLICYAVCFGGPIASQFIHIYCKLGTKKIIQIGICGGLQKKTKLGDIIVSSSVLSMDGVAKLYKQKSNQIGFDSSLIKKVTHELNKRKLKFHVGSTISYYDILLEEEKDLVKYCDQGYLGVEMEAAATASVAQFFGVPAIAFFVVADNSISGKDLFYNQTEEEQTRIKTGIETIFELALDL